jgi:hypothetical protein
MGWLTDKILSVIDADYVPLTKFTSDPGTFGVGNRVREADPAGFEGRVKPRFYEVTRVERRYERDGNHWDQGWARRVDGLGGCNCGHPGCPG